jgi:AcrR family transcriptional regulator
MKRRAYQLRRRAESQAQTRLKIVEATVHLHEVLGPKATTVRAIAERAGVQRLTVYRHFPDDVALLHACSSHWLARHPLPDPTIWCTQESWRARCRAAFAALYTYYRMNSGMLASVYRDADLPALAAPLQDFESYFRQMRTELVETAEPALVQSKAFSETIRHALAFTTWQSLADGFSDGEMVALVMQWLEGVAARALAPRASEAPARRDVPKGGSQRSGVDLGGR